MGDVRIEAQLRDCLGSALGRQGRNREARECLRMAIDLLADTSDQVSRALVLCSTAENEALDGQESNTFWALNQASAIFAKCDGNSDSELGRRLLQVKALASSTFNHGLQSQDP